MPTATNDNLIKSRRLHKWLSVALFVLTVLLLIIIFCIEHKLSNMSQELSANDQPQTPLAQSIDIKDGSVTNAKLAPGAITLDSLSQQLQQYLQGLGGQPGSSGSSGSTGETGPQGGPGVLFVVNDVNVTGSLNTLTDTLTMGWAAQLSVGRGGTNGSANPTAGGVAFGDGDSYEFTGAGIAGMLLISNGSISPSWIATADIPCPPTGNFYCQGGNSFGATGVLGTTDGEDLQVVADGTKNTLFDTSGNQILNISEDSGSLGLSLGAGVNSNYLTNKNSVGVGSTISGVTEGNFITVIDSNLSNITYSYGGYGASTASNITSLFGNVAFSDINNVDASNVNFAFSTVDGLSGSQAYLNRTTIDNVFGLFGFTGWATLTDAVYVAGKFEGINVDSSSTLIGNFGQNSCDTVLGCPVPDFEIFDSFSIVGHAIYTNIYDSSGLSLYTNSNDPTAFITTISDVHSSSISGIDLDISDTYYSSIIGNFNTVSGLDHSTLLGDSVTLADPGVGTYDYSFLGADITGAINTRINFKGDDSWLNLSGGSVGVGTSTPANKLDVADASDDTPASFTGTSGTCTVDTFGGGWSCVSDAKLKTNIAGISSGLDTVLALNGVTYNWLSDPTSDKKVSGFIAQEVQKILPGLVTTLDDGTLSLNKDGILPYLVEAVKEQNGKLEGINIQLADSGLKIDSLSEELKELAGRVDTLEEEFNNYKKTTDERIKELEQRTSGSSNSLPTQP